MKQLNFDVNNGGSCYDCGSTIPGHHTPDCGLAGKGDIRDLPQIPGTQWWTACKNIRGEFVPAEKRPTKLMK